MTQALVQNGSEPAPTRDAMRRVFARVAEKCNLPPLPGSVLISLAVPNLVRRQALEHERVSLDVGSDFAVPGSHHQGDGERIAGPPNRDLRYESGDTARLLLRGPLSHHGSNEASRRQPDPFRRTCSAAMAARTASCALLTGGTPSTAVKARLPSSVSYSQA